MGVREGLAVKVKKGKSCLCHVAPEDFGVVASRNETTARVSWMNEKGDGKEIHRFNLEDLEEVPLG